VHRDLLASGGSYTEPVAASGTSYRRLTTPLGCGCEWTSTSRVSGGPRPSSSPTPPEVTTIGPARLTLDRPQRLGDAPGLVLVGDGPGTGIAGAPCRARLFGGDANVTDSSPLARRGAGARRLLSVEEPTWAAS